jgi:hypothetical protein
MSGDSVEDLFTPEGLAKLPEPWRKHGTAAFKQLCLSHGDELRFRQRIRSAVFWTYLGFVLVFGVLNVGAALGWWAIVAAYQTFVMSMGGGAFAPVVLKVATDWVAPHFTRRADHSD